MINKQERMWQEAILDQFEYCLYLSGENEGNHDHLSHDGMFPSRDLIHRPSEYETRILPIWPWYSIWNIMFIAIPKHLFCGTYISSFISYSSVSVHDIYIFENCPKFFDALKIVCFKENKNECSNLHRISEWIVQELLIQDK